MWIYELIKLLFETKTQKYENQMSMTAEKHQILENSLHDKEKTINENAKLLINYQIEVSHERYFEKMIKND